MNGKIKMALVAGLALGGLGFAAQSASAAPVLDRAVAHAGDLQHGVQNVRYVCGYWGCHWRPGYGYGYGWHRWHYWHRWHHWHHYW